MTDLLTQLDIASRAALIMAIYGDEFPDKAAQKRLECEAAIELALELVRELGYRMEAA